MLVPPVFFVSKVRRYLGHLKPYCNRFSLFVLVIPIFLYGLCVQFARGSSRFYRDPRSEFFDRTRAFDRFYTAQRLDETRAFVQNYNLSDAPEFKRHASSNEPPLMCIGMNTIARPSGEVYARDALASVLAGLDQKERDMIYVMPLIGHINATEHPIYSEPWLSKVADRVLTYDTSETLPKIKYHRIKELELDRKRTGEWDREKHLTDYTHLLRVCAATGAPYVTMFEDDALAVDNWFYRERQAIEALNKQAGPNGWFYLRLFYTENYLGWNGEDIYWYWAHIGLYAIAVFCLFKIATNYARQGPTGAAFLQKTGPVLLVATVLSFSLGVHFIFKAGKVALFGNRHGLVYMPMYGCCAQGITYPNAKVKPLTDWYEKNRIGFVDTLAERLADEKPDGFDVGTRWAVSPALVQHFGGQSSKGDGWPAGTLWNFEFETYNQERLRQEHERVVKQMA